MGHKRQKEIERVLRFYRINFGFRPPYQVLIDGTLCAEALKTKINIKEQFMSSFNEQVNLYTTMCSIVEIENLGKAMVGPTLILKQYKVLKCGHENKPVPASQCLRSLIKPNDNERHYMIATQDPKLQEWARKRVAVPLLFIAWKTINLDKPSEITMKSLKDRINVSLADSDPQLERIRLLKEKEGLTQPSTKKFKKKKAKGPNPLSCRKSQKRPKYNRPGGSGDGKKKRKRKRKSSSGPSVAPAEKTSTSAPS